MFETKLKIALYVVLGGIISVSTALADTDTGSVTTGDWYTFEISDRSENSWKVRSADMSKLNQRDCLDNVTLTFKAELKGLASNSSNTLYLYAGSDCDDDENLGDECWKLGENGVSSNTRFFKNIPFSAIFPTNNCDADESVTLWLGLLEKEDSVSGNDDFIDSVETLRVDVDGPSEVPSNIGTKVGNGSIEVSWDEIDNNDVSGFVAVYWSSEDGPMDEDAQMPDTDEDTDSQIDSDTGAILDTESDTDIDSDTGTDTNIDTDTDSDARFFIRAPGDSDDTDSSSATCPAEGGFEGGEEINPSTISGVKKALSSSGATRIVIDGLTNYRAYNVGVVAVDEYGNPSLISDQACNIPLNTSGIGDGYEGAGGKGGGNYCFIATAAFGSYEHPTVMILREFRDSFLREIPGGTGAIHAYYSAGPTMASWVDEDSSLKHMTRQILTLFAGFTLLLMAIGPLWIVGGITGSVLIGLALGFALPGSRRNR